MNRIGKISSVVLMGVMAAGCGKDKDSSSGAGTFPDFGSLALQAAPSFASSMLSAQAVTQNDGPNFGLFTFPSTSFSTTPSEWTTATASNSDLISTVLLNGGISGTVKSMFVVIAKAQSEMASINSSYSDSSGNAANCTAISSSVTPTIPFFATATGTAFNAWTDAGMYTCYTSVGSNGVMAFGRQAISSPPSGCTDAFRYYAIDGSSQDDATNTEDVGTRGATVDGSSMSRYYYDGCTKDLNIIYAQSTIYAAGLEFSSRTELTGNTDTHTFSMRIGYIDANGASGGSFTSFLGTGKAIPATGATSNFIIGYDRQNCTGAASSSYTCTTSSSKEFCAKNAGTTSSSSELDTTVANCSSLTSTYTALSPLTNANLPHAYFAVTASGMGL